jgi:predicted N-acyltransferase
MPSLDGARARGVVQIKKERRGVYEESGVELEVLRGDAIPDRLFDQDLLFQIYKSTVDKMYWG